MRPFGRSAVGRRRSGWAAVGVAALLAACQVPDPVGTDPEVRDRPAERERADEPELGLPVGPFGPGCPRVLESVDPAEVAHDDPEASAVALADERLVDALDATAELAHLGSALGAPGVDEEDGDRP